MIQPLLFTPSKVTFHRGQWPIISRLALFLQLPNPPILLKRPTSTSRVRRWRGRISRRAARGGFVAPSRRIVVVAACVRRQDAPGVGGRPLDLLAHVAIVGDALVVAPAHHWAEQWACTEHHHKFTSAAGCPWPPSARTCATGSRHPGDTPRSSRVHL